jgi:hypothetical protein
VRLRRTIVSKYSLLYRNVFGEKSFTSSAAFSCTLFHSCPKQMARNGHTPYEPG